MAQQHFDMNSLNCIINFNDKGYYTIIDGVEVFKKTGYKSAAWFKQYLGSSALAPLFYGLTIMLTVSFKENCN